jgi:hypothetical protein
MIDWNSFVQWAFYGILSGCALYGCNIIAGMKTSIDTLNTNVGILFTGCASKRKLIIGKDCYYGYRDINGTLTKADHSICEEANKE